MADLTVQNFVSRIKSMDDAQRQKLNVSDLVALIVQLPDKIYAVPDEQLTENNNSNSNNNDNNNNNKNNNNENNNDNNNYVRPRAERARNSIRRRDSSKVNGNNEPTTKSNGSGDTTKSLTNGHAGTGKDLREVENHNSLHNRPNGQGGRRGSKAVEASEVGLNNLNSRRASRNIDNNNNNALDKRVNGESNKRGSKIIDNKNAESPILAKRNSLIDSRFNNNNNRRGSGESTLLGKKLSGLKDSKVYREKNKVS